ncbi:MAG: hypothetical protein CM1200mP29_05880 [Verrucomicrobiota bacterium]|nr:MAG: hypothetical protein CM1200mP29_05880 [Verrucomicrobiota bacterium]
MARPGVNQHAPTATCAAGFAPKYMLLKVATILSMHATVTTGMETIEILTRPV